MAQTLEDINKVKQRCRAEARKPGVAEALKALFKHMEQLRNPDLQFVPLDYTANADIVISDVPGKLYALYLKKPTASATLAVVKISDDAATCNAASEFMLPFVATGGGGQEHCAIFPDGLKFNTGMTTASHTTVAGAVDSADADACVGFAIIGAA